MPKKKEEKKQFFVKGRDVITDETAPTVSNEFVTADGEYRGQTVEVHSTTHLEDDKGVGPAIILRTFEFAIDPEKARKLKSGQEKMPPAQEIFQSHVRGILSILWADHLRPAEEIAPRLIFSKKYDRYLIMVGAVPQIGQTILETPQTLSEIAHGNKDKADTKRVFKLPNKSTVK